MRKRLAIAGVTAIVLGGLFAALTAPTFAQGTTNVPGANKYHQDGQVNPITRTENDSDVPLFDKDPSTEAADPIVMRTSTTGDLIIEVHAECFITVTDSNGDVRVRVHVAVDGQPVPVAEETEDVGKVNFCDRNLNATVTHTRSTDAGLKPGASSAGTGGHTHQANAEFRAP